MSFVVIVATSLHLVLASSGFGFPITRPALEAGFFMQERYW